MRGYGTENVIPSEVEGSALAERWKCRSLDASG